MQVVLRGLKKVRYVPIFYETSCDWPIQLYKKEHDHKYYIPKQTPEPEGLTLFASLTGVSSLRDFCNSLFEESRVLNDFLHLEVFNPSSSSTRISN